VKDFGFRLQQKRSIKIIIPGEFKILARESFDRINVVPGNR